MNLIQVVILPLASLRGRNPFCVMRVMVAGDRIKLMSWFSRLSSSCYRWWFWQNTFPLRLSSTLSRWVRLVLSVDSSLLFLLRQPPNTQAHSYPIIVNTASDSCSIPCANHLRLNDGGICVIAGAWREEIEGYAVKQYKWKYLFIAFNERELILMA